MKKFKNNFNDFFILFSVLIIFFILSQVIYGFYKLGDDTYIYLQYARNFYRYKELSFNVGMKSYGFTGPLWLILIIILKSFIKNDLIIPQVLSMAFSMLYILIWFFILKKDIKNKILLFLYLLFISVDPNLLKHSNFGMEAALSYFLSSIAILITIIKNIKVFWLSILFGIYQFVRPESVLIFLTIVFYLAIERKILKSEIKKLLFIFTLIILPWYIFTYLYFGQFLPSTFFAKGGAYPLGNKFLQNFYDIIIIFSGNYLLIFCIIIIMIFKLVKMRVYTELKQAAFLLIIIFIISIFYSVMINNEYIYARYFCMVFPFLIFSFIIIINKYFELTQIKPGLISFAIIIFIISSFFYSNKLRNNFIEQENLENSICEWIKANTEVNDKVVRGRIGKIGYISQRIIIDPVGLINPEIIWYNRNNNISRYYFIKKPTYFIGHFEDLFKKFIGEVHITKRKLFVNESRYLLRQLFEKLNKKDTTIIYQVNWNNSIK